ncbi:MAG: helix-turn-helix domain-containing protein [Sulfurovaceae bacterium]|nr:helix-turn-helix domain-containing protein [Sulfurovaceae bacterium]MDD5549501.1 helix-turn-helix domain-containing protein [Sulfurovaceae bacterium]
MIYAYMRQYLNSESVSQQRKSIATFALKKSISINKEVIEYTTKNVSVEERLEFEKFVHTLKKGDIIVLSDISILSSSAEDVVKVITCLISRGVEAWVANSRTSISKETSLREFLPYLNDLRDAQKKVSKTIGRPKGSRSNSKFDSLYSQILKMLNNGDTVSLIAREFNVSRSSLKDYIQSRGIKDILNDSNLGKEPSKRLSDKLIICPFDKKNITKG